jgi:hypothetical protein
MYNSSEFANWFVLTGKARKTLINIKITGIARKNFNNIITPEMNKP